MNTISLSYLDQYLCHKSFFQVQFWSLKTIILTIWDRIEKILTRRKQTS